MLSFSELGICQIVQCPVNRVVGATIVARFGVMLIHVLELDLAACWVPFLLFLA